MRTGRWFRGLVVLGGVAGAGAYAWLSRPVTEVCSGPPNPATGRCHPGELERTERSWAADQWMPAAIAGGALMFLGAFDALIGAKEINRERLLATGGAGTEPTFELSLQPPVMGSNPVLTLQVLLR